METVDDKFKEEVRDLIKPYLKEESNADYLAIKIKYLHEDYSDRKE